MNFKLVLNIVDLVNSALFMVGSILFLNDATVKIGTWMFVIASFFAMISALSQIIYKR